MNKSYIKAAAMLQHGIMKLRQQKCSPPQINTNRENLARDKSQGGPRDEN
jgi:hypothetical protein